MKKVIVGGLLGLLIGGVGTWLYFKHQGSDTPPAASAAKPEEKPKENPLHLPAAKRAAAGITLVHPAQATLTPTVEVFGRVVDATGLVTLAAEFETAKAAFEGSTKERERLAKLFAAGNNASAQAVETADAVVARDHAALASARVRLVTSWGKRLTDEAQLVHLIDALAAGQVLVRIDLLLGDMPAPDIKTAQLGVFGSDERFDAEVLGPAPSVDAQGQGASFIALVRDHPLPLGATLRGTVAAAGASGAALTIPRRAIVYHQGSPWIYVLDEEDTFERRLVALGRSKGDDVVVMSGVEAEQQVVTTGAQQLLAAELQSGEQAEEP